MFYKFIKGVAWIVAYILYRPVVTGAENIPKTGPYLLSPNHIHAFDPVGLAVFMKRQPRFMAKKELFRRRFLNWLLSSLGAFPVDRGATDMQAFRKSMDILKRGHGLMIFAQGTRMKEFENVKSGVAVFALKSGAPIIPAGIRGSYKFRSKVYINIGEPISMEKYKGQKVKTELVEEVMAIVKERVSELSK